MRLWTVAAAAVFLSGATVSWAADAPGERPGERAASVSSIPGVVAAGAKWEMVVSSLDTMDGVVGLADGGVLFAQEQTNSIRKVDAAGRESVYLTDTKGGGSISLDPKGVLWVVQRTCTDPGLNLGPEGCKVPTTVAILAPQRRVVVDHFADGATLGRINDVIADGKGGAYFTSGGAWYVSAAGVISVVADQNLRSNGVMLSSDGRTLYVTNDSDIQAFDVAADGTTRNRRTFASLKGDTGGDGMAIDGVGRLYVTAQAGVHVIGPDGAYLGLIPTPRRPIAVAFSGADKKDLWVIQTGAVGPDGKAWTTPPGVRNNAKTLYRISMLAQGFKGRPK